MHVANNKVHNSKCLGYDALPVGPTTSLGTNLISGMWYDGEWKQLQGNKQTRHPN